MLLTVQVGGTGLNLTAASHVVHYDRCYNPAREAQATDRCHRIGQKEEVTVRVLSARGTFEEWLDELLRPALAAADKK